MTKTIPIQPKSRKYLRNAICYNPSKLIKIRKDNNFEREDVVRELGISYDTIFNLETGRVKSPQWTTMFSLAELYKRSLDDFTDKKINKFYCSELEQKLIKAVRKHPELNLNNIIDILNDNSLKGNLIRELIRDALLLPNNIIKNYHQLNEIIITNLLNQQEIDISDQLNFKLIDSSR